MGSRSGSPEVGSFACRPSQAADELHAKLIGAVRLMDEREALASSACLVLLLVERVGDPGIVRNAIA